MDHRRASRLLTDLEAGVLGDAERRELLLHLDDCDECRDWLESFRLFSDALRADRAGAGDHPSSDTLARRAVDPARLGEPESAELEAHLESCPSCRQELSTTRAALRRASAPSAAPLAGLGRLAARTPTPVRLALAASLLLVAGIALWPTGSTLENGQHRSLESTSLGGKRTIEARRSITAESVAIEEGGDVTFRAGEGVILGNGFSIGEGAEFKVEIAEPAGERAPEEST